jgi:hypothetical protein
VIQLVELIRNMQEREAMEAAEVDVGVVDAVEVAEPIDVNVELDVMGRRANTVKENQ